MRRRWKIRFDMARRRHTSGRQLEAMGRAVNNHTAELLIGVCVTCRHEPWFAVNDVGERCPEDHSQGRGHECNYYVLVGVRR